MNVSTMSLRKHQHALRDLLIDICEEYKSTGRLRQDKIVEEIFPGGGKSTHPIIAGKILMDYGIVDKICWVAPRTSLKVQGAQEFDKLYFKEVFPHGLRIRETENSADNDPTRGSDGFITTYQALVSARSNNSRRQDSNLIEFRRKKYLLFLDECQHITPDTHDREGYSFYQAVKPLVDKCSFLLLASGTMFRNDPNQKVAFVDYDDEIRNGKPCLVPRVDIRYSYKDSLKEKANIPLVVNHGDTEFVKYTKDGKEIEKYRIENGDDRRAALCTEYGKALLEAGLKDWRDYRMRHNTRSKLIIVASNQRECKTISARLVKAGLPCALAISDEPKAHADIKRFREDPNLPILVTCQMAYEGLDCKEATHLVVLTDIRSLPWLVQMLTRVMRADTHEDAIPYERQWAKCFCPDDDLMKEALDYVHAQHDIVVNKVENELEDLLSDLDVSSSREWDMPEKPIIENMSSKMAGVSQNDPMDGDHLPPHTLIKVQQFQLKHGIHQPEIETYRMLKALNRLDALDEGCTPVIPSVSPNENTKTIREQEQERRNQIQKQANRLDYKFGFECGTWNKKLHNHFRGRRRKDMNLDELKRCYEWMIEEAKRIAIEMRRNHSEEKDDSRLVVLK